MHCIAIFHTIDGMNLSNYLTFPCAYDIAVQQLELLGDGAGMDSAANQKKIGAREISENRTPFEQAPASGAGFIGQPFASCDKTIGTTPIFQSRLKAWILRCFQNRFCQILPGVFTIFNQQRKDCRPVWHFS